MSLLIRAAVLLLVALAACSQTDAPATTSMLGDAVADARPDDTADPGAGPDADGGPPTTTGSSRVRPTGFSTVVARVTSADADEPCEQCLWLADEASLRRRGLMGVTDLGAAVGMAFAYDEPRSTTFTMSNTLMPLSIAFYGPDGEYVDAFDMEPCRSEPCPSYRTPDGFTIAVEVPQGRLADLGLVPGSRLELLDVECDTPSSD
ncbi:MAG: DUF192 domain-containing protein [Ilumatobacteraceae bacterium]